MPRVARQIERLAGREDALRKRRLGESRVRLAVWRVDARVAVVAEGARARVEPMGVRGVVQPYVLVAEHLHEHATDHCEEARLCLLSRTVESAPLLGGSKVESAPLLGG